MLPAGEDVAQLRCLPLQLVLDRLSRRLEARRDQQVLHAAGVARASQTAAKYLTWDPPCAEERGAELTT